MFQTSGQPILISICGLLLESRRVSSVSKSEVHVSLAQRSAGALGVDGASRGLCEQTTHTCRSQNLFLVSEALEGGGQVDGRFDGCIPLRHVRLRMRVMLLRHLQRAASAKLTCNCTDVSDSVCRADAKSRYLRPGVTPQP